MGVDTQTWHTAMVTDIPRDEHHFAAEALVHALSKRVSQPVWDAAVREALALAGGER